MYLVAFEIFSPYSWFIQKQRQVNDSSDLIVHILLELWES